MRHRGPCLQLFYLNFALRGGTEFDVLKENVLTCFKITKSEKKNKFQLKYSTSGIRFHRCW